MDPGVGNLVTAVTTLGKSFIVDERKIKSINQWYNKGNARLQSIKDKQHFGKLQLKLKYLCELNDIKYVEQEESYTSQSSFWDNVQKKQW